MTRATARGGVAGVGRAFTLVELLVVVALFVVLLAIGVPAFRGMLESSDETMAENAMRGGVAAARDAAARGGQGQDAAAVFFYDSVSHKISIVPCVFVGTLLDQSGLLIPGGSNEVLRDVFVPMSGYEPSQLPRGWIARGYAGPNSIDNEWYGTGAYAGSNVRQQGNWLFPETDFYDWDVANSGANRQTFMIRFEGGTGALKPADGQAVLIVSPAPSDDFRNTGVFADTRFRLDTSANQLRTVRQILDAPFTGAAALTIQQRRQLLGDIASDTVLAKPVRLVSLCNDARGLAPYMNVRLDRATASIYQNATTPQFVSGVDLDTMNEYINGAEPNTPPNAPLLETRARIFSVHRYLGTLLEITGTIDGQGVGQ